MNLSATMTLDGAGFLGPLRAIQGGLGNVVGTIGSLGGALTGLQSAKALIGDLLGALNKPLALAGEMESINAEFGVMLGSVEKGKKMAADIQQFANVTPFETGGLAQSAKTLLSFGTAGENIIPILHMLGDVAGSSQEKLDSLTLAFAQISAAGKMQGQDLLQLINAGFNPLQEIARTSGQSLSSLRDQMEKGAISADMVTDSFRTATSEGGRFFNNMQVQSQTYNGLLSTLQDGIAQLYRAFGTPVINALKPILQEATDLTNSLVPVVSQLGEMFAHVVTQAGQVAGVLSRGLIGASQAGQVGNLLMEAVEGIPRFLLSGLSTVTSTVIQLFATGLQGAFKSAIALLTDGNFWGGLKSSVLAIANQFKAVILDAVATLAGLIPGKGQIGDQVKALAGSTRNLSDSQAIQAGVQFGQVDFSKVMGPMQDAAASTKSVLVQAFTTLAADVKSNSAWQDVWTALNDFSKHVADSATSTKVAAGDIKKTPSTPPTPKGYQFAALDTLKGFAADNLAKVGGFLSGAQGNDRQLAEAKKSNDLIQRVIVSADAINSSVQKFDNRPIWAP